MTFSACAYALKCLIDPDLPVNDGFYRARLGATRRAGTVDELHVAGAGRRRLGDADPARRGALPRAPARVPRAAAGGDEGDDVPGGLRLARRRDRRRTRASTTRSPAATAARFASDGPDAVQAHGQNTENAPIEETELNYPVRIDAARARRELRGPRPVPRRARPAQGLPLRPHDDVHDPRRPRPLRAVGRLRRARRRASPSTCSSATASRRGSARRRRSTSSPAT